MRNSKVTASAGTTGLPVAIALAAIAGFGNANPLTAASEAEGEPRAKPNILMILTDDQGYGDLSLHGNPYIETPNIDRIGSEGVRFDRFYVNSVCAPSRAAILTGRQAIRTGTHNVTGNRETMRPSEITIAEALRQGGYRTGCFGKWHNGSQYPSTPPGMGFDEFVGFVGGHINDYFDAVLLRGTDEVATEGYVTDVLTDEAIRFIDSAGDKPFFCYLSYNAPHDPYQVPDEYYDRVAKHGLNPEATAHLAMCANIDDNVGRILAHLEKEGLADNTVVLFLTDNGAAGNAAKAYNAGMRGWKTSTHEGGTRVPLFMRWPAADWTPHVVEELTSHVDLYPTLLDLCGVTAPEGPPVDGISVRPLIEDANANWSERTLFTHNPIDETNRYPGAVRTPQYRLVNRTEGPQAGSAARNRDDAVSPWELYDMKADPGETKDIASEKPELVKELAAAYDAWIDELRTAEVERLPLPVGHAEQNPVTLFASQAQFDGPVGFAVGGFAGDWLTNWTDKTGTIWFDLVVEEGGTYQAEVAFSCPSADAGSVVTLRCGQSSVNATVPAAPPVEISLPHRDGSVRYRNREWSRLELGQIALPSGRTRIVLAAESVPGGSVLDFKHLRLTRLPGDRADATGPGGRGE